MGKEYPANFNQAVKAIDDAVQASRASLSKYKKVSVLSILWENDNIGVLPTSQELMSVLEKTFKFDTKTYSIKIKGPDGHALTSQIVTRNFLAFLNTWRQENEGGHNLLILYYSGHAETSAPYTKFEWR